MERHVSVMLVEVVSAADVVLPLSLVEHVVLSWNIQAGI